MFENKKFIAGALGAVLALAAVSFVGAQNSGALNLTATCTSSVSENVITWMAAVNGGTAPYAYLWSGDASGTSSTAVSTHSATGTFQAMVTVSDAATSTATSTCSATVVSIPTGGDEDDDDEEVRLPAAKPPQLVINPSGNFLARGMKVISVGTSSFVGKVWGTTWTVNVERFPEFYLRGGHNAGAVSLSELLRPGDEVGVSGEVGDAEGIVNGRVVRNYSILKLRSVFKIRKADDDDDE